MTYLKSLSIKDYKGFYSLNEIEFAIPNQEGSKLGLNVIVWPNNTGKTTILEALMLTRDITNQRFNQEDRHWGKNPEIILIQDNGQEYKLKAEGSLIKTEWTLTAKINLLSSSRYWDSEVFTENDEGSFLSSENGRSLRKDSRSHLSWLLSALAKDEGKKKQFNKYMKTIFPHFSDWGIDSRNNKDFIYYRTWDWVVHSTDQLGKGILSLFLICGHLVASNDSILLIDEPELALHPQMQRRLALLLSEEAKRRQIIVCTHSPYFINWEDYLNWAKFIRLNKNKDQNCNVYKLNSESDTYSITFGVVDDRQKPQLLDIVAKEIFFAEKILFVEGQEDVWLIKKFAKAERITLNFEIFGYGSWWATNIKKFLQMAKDLWFTKAWALYDWDTRTDWEQSKTKFPSFKIIILPTADIRDKNTVYDSEWNEIAAAKEGVFDEHGKIKESTKEEFKRILSQFNEYFQ